MSGVLDAFEAAPLPSRRRVAGWVRQEPVLAGVAPGALRGVLLDETEPVDYDRRDDLLGALVRLSRTDEQAGTLLVWCLLPGLRVQLAQHGWGLDRDEAEAIAVAALCKRIWNYPLLRRPRKIAINLLLDTGHDLMVARDRELAYQANAHPTDRPIDRATDRDGDLTADMVWDDARRAGVVNDREIALIRATRLHDIPIDQVAPLVGMNHEAARKARQRAGHKLRAWWNTERGAA